MTDLELTPKAVEAVAHCIGGGSTFDWEERLEMAAAALRAAAPFIRSQAFREAASIAYRVCAETRHVTLGDQCAAELRAAAEHEEKVNG